MPSVARLVPPNLPPPPYPETILARGFAFDLDIDRVDRSDTWAITPADLRPWLLMVWAYSWRNAPCGTWPANDRIIAARIGISDHLFALHRETLMRGWRQHSDGRLYHQTITELVLKMSEKRTYDRVRQAEHRKMLDEKKDEENQSAELNVAVASRRTPNESTSATTPTPTVKPKDEGPADLCPPPAADALFPDVETETGKPPKPPRVPPVDHDAVVAAYHELLPTLPRVITWPERRQRLLRTRWRELAEYWRKRNKPWLTTADGVAGFRMFFGLVAKSQFLTGRAKAKPGEEPFQADLEWLILPSNFVKVCEGKYS